MHNAGFRKWCAADNCAFGRWRGADSEQIESRACNLFRQCGSLEKFLHLLAGRIGQLANLDGLAGEVGVGVTASGFRCHRMYFCLPRPSRNLVPFVLFVFSRKLLQNQSLPEAGGLCEGEGTKGTTGTKGRGWIKGAGDAGAEVRGCKKRFSGGRGCGWMGGVNEMEV